MEYQVIDNVSKKYATGGIDTKRRAEDVNKMLREAGLELLNITVIFATEENLEPPYIKSGIEEIEREVNERIKEKTKNNYKL